MMSQEEEEKGLNSFPLFPPFFLLSLAWAGPSLKSPLSFHPLSIELGPIRAEGNKTPFA